MQPQNFQQQESDRDRPIERERWLRVGRQVPGAPALRYRAHQQKMRQRMARAAGAPSQQATTTSTSAPAQTVAPTVTTPPANAVWTSLGPAPILSDPTGGQSYGFVSGRGTRVLVDQSDATGNTVYLAGAFGGLWKSTNGAAAPGSVVWTPLLDDQPTLAIGAIAIKPDNNQVLLVGTGEPNSTIDSYYGLGILRSTDGGASWTLITSADAGAHPFQGLGFSRIAFSSDNTNLVVGATAATNGALLGAGGASTVRGLYYSTDAGATWQLASITDSGTPIAAGSATSVVYNPVAHKFFAAVRFHGVYSSTDGINWSRLTRQPSTLLTLSACSTTITNGNCPLYRGELAVRAGSPGTMFFWFVDSGYSDKGIFETTDGGATWIPLSVSGIDNCGDSQGCGTQQGGYNLALAAVATSNGTDLYAGAINLFKCSINISNPSCGVAGAWKNLTHVYGCSPIAAPAHVHPDQHDIDFSLANPSILYFANDGGIYRTLNGPGLASGSCAASNPFDNLNGSLGSMSEFVSFSLSPADPSTILGGTQDNGSPAIDSGHSGSNGTTWTAVNGGDGGFNAINPAIPTEWFTANTDVSIQRCTAGINCTAGSFPTVIGSAQVGNDHGDFYTPYLLDLQASDRIIVGTCRVWRGPSSGTGWTSANALSGSLTGDALPCSGSAGLVIRSLAAGGPLGANGSQVIYAGTSGGQIFVTANADSATPTWSPGTLNAMGFPISDIALDPSDPSGLSAYATVMGFGVGHVFKTNNGTVWQDVSANLPDAPANSVLVDPNDPTTVYVGTDVGVFFSTDAGVSWAEYGPITGPGFLPNVPATRLRAFISGGTRKLRASTYGRGVWETDMPVTGPDFVLALPLPNIAIYAGQSASFSGTLTAISGYSSTVNVSCSGSSVPPTCTGGSFVPAAGGTAFTVSASANTIADFNFKIVAAGTDPAATTRQSAAVLRVVDFSLQSLNSAPIFIGTSTTVPVASVHAAGSFNGNVTVACDPATLPAGITCTSAVVQPTASAPALANLTFVTAASTAAGSYPIGLIATADNPAGVRTQNITLVVSLAPPDFSISATATTPTTILAGGSVSFDVSVAPQSAAFNDPVNLTCTGLPQHAACNFAANPVLPASNGAHTGLTISTVARVSASLAPRPRTRALLYALWIAMPFATVLFATGKPRRKRRALLLLLLLLVAGTLHISCGGGGSAASSAPAVGSSGTPPGTYTVTVVASSVSATHNTTVTFTVQ